MALVEAEQRAVGSDLGVGELLRRGAAAHDDLQILDAVEEFVRDRVHGGIDETVEAGPQHIGSFGGSLCSGSVPRRCRSLAAELGLVGDPAGLHAALIVLDKVFGVFAAAAKIEIFFHSTTNIAEAFQTLTRLLVQSCLAILFMSS